MSQTGKIKADTALPRAFSRLCGLYLGAFMLATTYIVAVLSDVQAPTALLRATMVGIVFAIIGRVGGWFAGRAFETSLRSGGPEAGEPEPEATA